MYVCMYVCMYASFIYKSDQFCNILKLLIHISHATSLLSCMRGILLKRRVPTQMVKFNSLPDDKRLEQSKFKQTTDGVLSSFKMENKYHIR